jgi:hypothetical protein
VAKRSHVRPLTLEASPYYLPHPLAPYRIRDLLPNLKMVVLLRNPVDRAVSHYHHGRRRGYEHLPFVEATRCEPERLAGEVESIVTAPFHNSLKHQYYSYLTRGRYAEQLELWFSIFDRDQFLILDSACLFSDPRGVMHRVAEFVGIPSNCLPSYHVPGKGSYQELDPVIREQLRAFFAPHNERLWTLIGERFDWR